MSGDFARKVSSGESIGSSMDARTWNAFVEKAREKGAIGGSAKEGAPLSALKVVVKNATGGNLGRGDVVRLDEDAPVTLPEDDEYLAQAEPILTATTPEQTNGLRDPLIGILTEPIPAGGYGEAAIWGCVATRVLVGSSVPIDDEYEYARPAATCAHLAASSSGPVRILRREPGTSGITPKKAIVFLHQLPGASGQTAGLASWGQDFQYLGRGAKGVIGGLAAVQDAELEDVGGLVAGDLFPASSVYAFTCFFAAAQANPTAPYDFTDFNLRDIPSVGDRWAWMRIVYDPAPPPGGAASGFVIEHGTGSLVIINDSVIAGNPWYGSATTMAFAVNRSGTVRRGIDRDFAASSGAGLIALPVSVGGIIVDYGTFALPPPPPPPPPGVLTGTFP